MKQIKSWAQYYVDLMTKLGLVRFSMFLATAINQRGHLYPLADK